MGDSAKQVGNAIANKILGAGVGAVDQVVVNPVLGVLNSAVSTVTGEVSNIRTSSNIRIQGVGGQTIQLNEQNHGTAFFGMNQQGNPAVARQMQRAGMPIGFTSPQQVDPMVAQFVGAVAQLQVAQNDQQRNEALAYAKQAAESFRKQDGNIHFPVGASAPFANSNRTTLNYRIDNQDAHFATPEQAIMHASAVMAQVGVGRPIQLNGPLPDYAPQAPAAAKPAVPQYNLPPSTSQQQQPVSQNQQPAPAADIATSPVVGGNGNYVAGTALPPAAEAVKPVPFAAAEGQQAHAYGGVKDKPNLTENQVRPMQELLGLPKGDGLNQADGKWGPVTQKLFEEKCKLAGVDPATVDFTDDKNPAMKTLLAKLSPSQQNAPVLAQQNTVTQPLKPLSATNIATAQPTFAQQQAAAMSYYTQPAQHAPLLDAMADRVARPQAVAPKESLAQYDVGRDDPVSLQKQALQQAKEAASGLASLKGGVNVQPGGEYTASSASAGAGKSGAAGRF